VTSVAEFEHSSTQERAASAEWRARLFRVVSQLGQLIAVLLAVSLLTFLIMQALPGSAVDNRIGPLPGFTPAEREELRQQIIVNLGLDRPLPYQYLVWMGNALRGDFGFTYQGLAVSQLVGSRIWATVELGLASLLVSTLLSVLVSLYAYRTRSRAVKGAIQSFVTVLFVMPAFWLGLLLVIVIAAQFNLLPSAGYVAFSTDAGKNLRYLVLPALTLALPQMALFFRYLNAGLRDVSRLPFVTSCRARGLSQRRVDYRHVLPNAILPTITVVGLVAGSLLSGLVIVESVFTWPGLGMLLVDSVGRKDYNTVAAIVLITSVVYVLVAFVVDFVYQLVDPRTRRRP
jgi:peptide/nickel transport system permease protein